MLAATTGGFLTQSGVTKLCSNEQLAEEIAVTLHMLKLRFCFRVCRCEVTTLK